MKKIILICSVLTLGFFLISCDDDATGPKPQDTPAPFTPTPIPTATEIPETPTPKTPSYQGEWSGWIETTKHTFDPECFDGTIWFRVIDDTYIKGDATFCVLANTAQYASYPITKVFEFEGPIIDGKFEYIHYENYYDRVHREFKISGSFDSYRTITGTWRYYYNLLGEYHEWGGGQWHAEKIRE